ncbi:MAG TPA: ACP S-malonyltransferase [Myxococcota bacterium]|nr:ACP S-malonyltransferase [Myxococcota bacterium]HQK50658.1 ACP S-malonyltransferase [Myxococcota bacterium]
MGATTAFLFPGQGSQVVGMGADLAREDPEARRLFEMASDCTGTDVLALCSRGPFEALSRTRVLQPAITTVSLACHAWLRSRGLLPQATAGHSLGEIAALCCAGCLSDADAIRLASVRGAAMDDAASIRAGAMIAVVGLPLDQVVEQAAALLDPEEGGVANLNAPDQVVLSGTVEAMDRATRHFEAQEARCVPLAVSGAWHSRLMAPAEAPFREALARVDLRPPARHLYLNATGHRSEDVQDIRQALVAQLQRPVQWVAVVEGLRQEGVTRFVEVGPGRVLRGTLRRIWPDASAYEAHCVGDLPSLGRLAAAWGS